MKTLVSLHTAYKQHFRYLAHSSAWESSHLFFPTPVHSELSYFFHPSCWDVKCYGNKFHKKCLPLWTWKLNISQTSRWDFGSLDHICSVLVVCCCSRDGIWNQSVNRLHAYEIARTMSGWVKLKEMATLPLLPPATTSKTNLSERSWNKINDRRHCEAVAVSYFSKNKCCF